MSEMLGKEVKGVMPTYISFLMGRLMQIWEAWDSGDGEQALIRAIRLVTFLPRDLKKECDEDAEFLREELRKASQTKGIDFYTTQIQSQKAIQRVATLYLREFVDGLVDLLDERGYLEKTKEFQKGRFMPRA